MNSVFVNPGIYSCAVDAFLEISTHLFLPYEFTDLLLMFVDIIKSGGTYSAHYF